MTSSGLGAAWRRKGGLMPRQTAEQVLRQEAIRRRGPGARRINIGRDRGRALPWFDRGSDAVDPERS